MHKLYSRTNHIPRRGAVTGLGTPTKIKMDEVDEREFKYYLYLYAQIIQKSVNLKK